MWRRTYNNWLVLLSFLVAVLASYTALDLASRITASTGAAAVSWLHGRRLRHGHGHLVDALHRHARLQPADPHGLRRRHHARLDADRDHRVGLRAAHGDPRTLSARRLAAGGVLMGIGICAMHYTGMAAMQVTPAIRYDPLLFAASVAIAIAAATAALWIVLHAALELGAAPATPGWAARSSWAPPSSACTTPAWRRRNFAAGQRLHRRENRQQLVDGRDDRRHHVPHPVRHAFALGARRAHGIEDGADGSSLREANAELQRLVLHDSLTKLPNRLLLEDRIQQAIAECRSADGAVRACSSSTSTASRPSTTRSATSRATRVLRTVAERLRGAVRHEDTVSRLGGDEFVVLLKHVAHGDDAGEIAHKIIEAVAAPIVAGRARAAHRRERRHQHLSRRTAPMPGPPASPMPTRRCTT